MYNSYLRLLYLLLTCWAFAAATSIWFVCDTDFLICSLQFSIFSCRVSFYWSRQVAERLRPFIRIGCILEHLYYGAYQILKHFGKLLPGMLAIVLVFKRNGCFVKFYIVWFNCVFVCMCVHVWWEKQTGTIKMLVNSCILANTTSTSHFLHSTFSVKQDKLPLYVCTMTWYTLSHHLYGNFCLYIKNSE